VLTTCEHCKSTVDFALYALPTPLLEYIREIAFAGVSYVSSYWELFTEQRDRFLRFQGHLRPISDLLVLVHFLRRSWQKHTGL